MCDYEDEKYDNHYNDYQEELADMKAGRYYNDDEPKIYCEDCCSELDDEDDIYYEEIFTDEPIDIPLCKKCYKKIQDMEDDEREIYLKKLIQYSI